MDVNGNKLFDGGLNCSHSSSCQSPLTAFMFNNVKTNSEGQKKLWYKWGRDWWVSAIPYANFLRSYGIFDAVSWCCSQAYATECSNCGNIVYRGVYCDKKHFCPICGNKYAWEKTKRVLGFFEDVSRKLPNLYIININFTLPQILWELDAERVADGLGRVVRRVFERYFRGFEVGGYMDFHAWHSRNPLLGSYYHYHAFILNYVLNKKTGEFKRINAKLSESRLKKIYLQELKREFGRLMDGVKRINLKIVRFYNFKKDYADLEHSVYYAFRMPQHDVVKYMVESGRDWDLEPSEEQWLYELLTMKITRTRWFGFLSCSKRGAFGWRLKKLEKEWSRCPYCGAVLDGWRRISAEDLEDLLTDRPPPLR